MSNEQSEQVASLLDRIAELERDYRLIQESSALEITNLRNELERERMRLAVCGVVALANTPESAGRASTMKIEYRSDSLTAVESAVDEQMRLRVELEQVKNERDEHLKWRTDLAAWLQDAEAKLARKDELLADAEKVLLWQREDRKQTKATLQQQMEDLHAGFNSTLSLLASEQDKLTKRCEVLSANTSESLILAFNQMDDLRDEVNRLKEELSQARAWGQEYFLAFQKVNNVLIESDKLQIFEEGDLDAAVKNVCESIKQLITKQEETK